MLVSRVAAQLPAEAIEDTVAAVFRQGAYDRGRIRFFERLEQGWAWLRRLFSRLDASLGDSAQLFWWIVAILALTLFAGLVRSAWLRRMRRGATTPAPAAGRAAGRAVDPWTAAQALAADGNYTEAAHALYRALLEGIARRETLRLHPAKTVGDYARELRARSSTRLPIYRDFARTYETVVYGLGWCDRERYERLRALAQPLVTADV